MLKYRESEEMYLETILLLKQKSANVHAVNAEALCDRAVLIAGGAIKEQGGRDLAHKFFFHE